MLFRSGLSRRNAPKQDENGSYIPNGQASKSGLFTANSLVPIRDMDLIAVRICQLACIILSTCSLSPFFHLSLKSPWMVNLRAVDDNFRVNQGNRNYNGHEVS